LLKGGINMDSKAVFAENLRRACSQFPTIKIVCNGTGINRQQFNKYLAGSSIPNSATLEKICAFLDVTQESMFSLSFKPKMETKRKGPSNKFGFLLPQDRDFDTEVPEFPAGNYLFYSPLQKIPGMIARSLLKIRNDHGGKSFIRISKLANAETRLTRRFGLGRHSGSVFSNETDIYLLGRNRFAPRQLSLIVFEKSAIISERCFTGLAITKSIGGLTALKFCAIQAEKETSAKNLLSLVGTIHESDSSIDPFVSVSLK
jgi:transcriptional regulator with XRE-family HTH domain